MAPRGRAVSVTFIPADPDRKSPTARADHVVAVTECFHSQGFEADLPDSIAARRNVLVAHWAGRLAGLEDEELTAFPADPASSGNPMSASRKT
jgi:hypothetical protein